MHHSKWKGWDLNPGCLNLELVVFSTTYEVLKPECASYPPQSLLKNVESERRCWVCRCCWGLGTCVFSVERGCLVSLSLTDFKVKVIPGPRRARKVVAATLKPHPKAPLIGGFVFLFLTCFLSVFPLVDFSSFFSP